MRRLTGALVTVAAIFVMAAGATAQIPAFPGAEGEGMYVTGGRGGDVYHVTNLNDSGPGSLRYGLESAYSARTIVFDISGVIELNSGLAITRPNITIAGQTAPGDGICITNYGLGVFTNNVILRHVRVRPGDACKGPGSEGGFDGDTISLFGSNIIVDHCSASWGIDECLSCAGGGFDNVTVQYCMITEGLSQTGLYHGDWDPRYAPGGEKSHAHGSLIKPTSGDGICTYHHNLWMLNNNRNPAIGSYSTSQNVAVDLRNNVMFNNGQNGYSSGESNQVWLNYVGNYIIAGAVTSDSKLWVAFKSNAPNNVKIYQSGNKIDGDRDGVLDGVDTGWGMFDGDYTPVGTAWPLAPVTTQTADEAYATVLAEAGALPWNRDSVDRRMAENLLNQTASGLINSQSEVGGYPVLSVVSGPPDTDQDGMPDWWENLHPELNYLLADNNGDFNGDGYTNLEDYLNYRAIPEPITIALMLLGGAGLARKRRV